MGSHSVTCHLAEVTFPHVPQPIKAGTQFRKDIWLVKTLNCHTPEGSLPDQVEED